MQMYINRLSYDINEKAWNLNHIFVDSKPPPAIGTPSDTF